MSNFVKNAGDSVRDIKEITRWVQIVEPDDALGLPAVEFEVKFINDAQIIRLSKPFVNKKPGGDVDLNKERKFRSNFLQSAVTDWRGVSNINLRRVSDFFLTHPEVFEKEDDREEWEFDKDDVGFIGQHISTDSFGVIIAEATNLTEFVRTKLEREKKDSIPS